MYEGYANGSTNPDGFQSKTFFIPRGITPQFFSLLGFTVSDELGNKQTDRLTDRLALLQSYFYYYIRYAISLIIKEVLDIEKSKITTIFQWRSHQYIEKVVLHLNPPIPTYASQGESSLYFSARWVSPFRMSQGTNKQTDSLKAWRFYRVMHGPCKPIPYK